MIYKYDTRIMVQFTNGTRASYSVKRYGTLLDRIVSQSVELDKKIWNYYEIDGKTTKLFYYDQSRQTEVDFLIDTEDLEKVSDYYWTLNVNGYVFTRTGGKTIFLHNLILDFDESKDTTDHINKIRTDNRKSNLRRVSFNVNSFNKSMQSNNTSDIIGVDRHRNKWRARIQFKDIKYSKAFDTKKEATTQRKLWEKELAVKFNDYDESQ